MFNDFDNRKIDKTYTEEIGVSIGVVVAIFIAGGVFIFGLSLIPSVDERVYSEEEKAMNQSLFDQGLSTTTIDINGSNSSATASTSVI